MLIDACGAMDGVPVAPSAGTELVSSGSGPWAGSAPTRRALSGAATTCGLFRRLASADPDLTRVPLLRCAPADPRQVSVPPRPRPPPQELEPWAVERPGHASGVLDLDSVRCFPRRFMRDATIRVPLCRARCLVGPRLAAMRMIGHRHVVCDACLFAVVAKRCGRSSSLWLLVWSGGDCRSSTCSTSRSCSFTWWSRATRSTSSSTPSTRR